MRITRDRGSLGAPPEGGAVTSIGVFDGVHLGHQAILAENVARARELGAEATVVTFSSHPKEVLIGRAPRTLTTLDHRLALFERAGVGHTLVLPFDEEVRRTSARAFAEELCVRGLDTRHFVLGFDSRFGEGREGDGPFLEGLGHPVTVVPRVELRQRGVSSTAIREAVELGDLAAAEAMLGRRVAVLGRVVAGNQLGRRLGFPTANLDLQHELHPPVGVYACTAAVLEDGRVDGPRGRWNAVCNIGFRPTVDGSPAPLPVVEAHLLDFEGDLYGERVELAFVARLRGEQRFPDLAALEARIRADVEAARTLLAEAHAASDGVPGPAN
jgi:riboflavin kinase/FMN adenylyltransferase